MVYIDVLNILYDCCIEIEVWRLEIYFDKFGFYNDSIIIKQRDDSLKR